jgi:hypothetical protein
MKKLVLTFLTFTLAFVAVNAQGRSYSHRQDQYEGNENSYGQQVERNNAYGQQDDRSSSFGANVNRLYDELNLSYNQRANAEQMNQRLRYQMQSLRNDNSLSQDQKRRQMMYFIPRNSSEFRSILNYQQAQQYDAMVSQVRQRAQQRNANYGNQDNYGRNQDGYGYGQQNNYSSNSQSMLNLLGSNNSLLSLLGNNLSLGSVLGSNFNLQNMIGSNLNINTILSLLSTIRQSR